MQLSDSYEAMFERASKAMDPADPSEAIEQYQHLLDRLLSLSPRARERSARLMQLAVATSMRLLVALRLGGQNERALALIERLRKELPVTEPVLVPEEALNSIDAGKVHKGLDILRTALMQAAEGRQDLRIMLVGELWAAGFDEEAMTAAQSALRVAESKEAVGHVAALLMTLETERDHPDEMIVYWEQTMSAEPDKPYYYPLLERLSAFGHWDKVAEVLEKEKNRWVKRLFEGELARARGDDEEARTAWQAILNNRKNMKSEADAYAWLSAMVLTERSGLILPTLNEAYAESPSDSSTLCMLIAALAQTGQVEAARDVAERSLRMTRLLRPYWKVFPHSYWLRLLRYPMPDEAAETLRPLFAQAEAAAVE